MSYKNQPKGIGLNLHIYKVMVLLIGFSLLIYIILRVNNYLIVKVILSMTKIYFNAILILLLANLVISADI